MKITEFRNVSLSIINDDSHEFLLSMKDVALGYGTSESNVRSQKSNHKEEFIEDKHYLKLKTNRNTFKILWTKKGIVRLGFFIKSKKAREFRDWAEDYIVQTKQNNQDLTNLTSAVLEQTKMLSQVFDRFNVMEADMRETKAIMHTIKRQASKIDDVFETTTNLDKFLKEQPIEEDQIFKIRNAVLDRAHELAKKHNIHAEIVINFIYSKIREKYSLKTYLSLRKTMFRNCLYMIDRIELTEYLSMPIIGDISHSPEEDIAQEKM